MAATTTRKRQNLNNAQQKLTTGVKIGAVLTQHNVCGIFQRASAAARPSANWVSHNKLPELRSLGRRMVDAASRRGQGEALARLAGRFAFAIERIALASHSYVAR
jgi:hypothetical protein